MLVDFHQSNFLFDAPGATAFANAPGGTRESHPRRERVAAGCWAGARALKQGAHGFAFVRNDRRDINQRFDLGIVRPAAVITAPA
jgi:hypothetical protein